MELRQVRSFLMLVNEGTFRRAAEKLHIVQPALSQQIHALEEELGCELFLRTSTGAKLTTAGQAFREEAEKIIAHTKRAREAVQRAARGQVGTVRIGFAASAAIGGRISRDLERFHAQYPRVTVELREMCATEQQAAIDEGRIDIGYGRVEPAAQHATVRCDALFHMAWVVALAASHPLADKPAFSMQDLQAQSFIVFGGEGERAGHLVPLREILAGEPTYMYQLNEALAVFALVAAGVGIALAPEPMCHLAIPGIVFRSLTDYAGSTTLSLLSRREESLAAVSNYRAAVLGDEGS
jgi:DNA-binding transcriptional LysR family regulator